MEYLKSINQKLRLINESTIEYIDILNYPQFIYGNLTNKSPVDFCKFPKHVQEEMNAYGELAVREMENLNSSSCGNRLRFHTSSKKIIFKVQLKRRFGYEKMVNLNSMGFDVYELDGDEYIHRTVFGPADSYNIFAEEISIPKNGNLCIFLPSYNTIQKMHIGIEKGSEIHPIDYPSDKQLPIVFYGNSVTQGAAASRSGNAFPSIVSKKLNRDIINLSCSSCCRGNESMAEIIGNIDCEAIVIDYTRNAYTTDIFRNTHEKFYKEVRKYHPETKIILLTSECFNQWKAYDAFDKIVFDTYFMAINRNENTDLIYQKKLFKKEEYNYTTIDSSHYTDYGMFKIANEICKLIED